MKTAASVAICSTNVFSLSKICVGVCGCTHAVRRGAVVGWVESG